MSDNEILTKDVEILTGDPKKAVIAIAIPTMIALMAQAINSVVDAAWVAGLGPREIAAVGVVFPIFFIIIGVGNGIGAGAAAAIARRIGSGNKQGADHSAAHAIVLILIASVIVTPILLLSAEPLLKILGDDDILQECLAYATPILMMTVIFFLVGVISNILRSEGAAKRAMYILIFAAILNLVLNPIFIYDYGLGLGLAGSAWATVVAESVALIMMIYWYFVKKDLFLKIRFKGFRFDRGITEDIFKVGLPASSEFFVISIVSAMMNLILLGLAGEDAVAIYTSDWRLIQMLIIPLMGIAMAVVPVGAAAYGARNGNRVKETYIFSIKISVTATIIISIVTAVFAPYITMIFTYGASASLKDGMVEFLRIACVFLPFMSMGLVSASLFQALGMGTRSLFSTVLRNGVMVPAAYAASLVGTLTLVWWATAAAEIVGCIIVGLWCFATVRAFVNKHKTTPEPI